MEMFEKERLKNSIDCRQNLINYFETYLDEKYKPRKAFVDLEDKKSVENYFLLTMTRLNGIRTHFMNGKNVWQRDRALGIL